MREGTDIARKSGSLYPPESCPREEEQCTVRREETIRRKKRYDRMKRACRESTHMPFYGEPRFSNRSARETPDKVMLWHCNWLSYIAFYCGSRGSLVNMEKYVSNAPSEIQNRPDDEGERGRTIILKATPKNFKSPPHHIIQSEQYISWCVQPTSSNFNGSFDT